MQRRGFSLIELVIVIVIIGVLAAIAIPRLSRGASGAGDSALSGNLKILRTAIDLYATEHGGAFPTAADVVDQLTKFTDENGNVSATRTGNFIYGPYLRSVPPLPVGARKGSTGIDVAANATNANVGWIYDPATGTIRANTTTETDARGTLYSAY